MFWKLAVIILLLNSALRVKAGKIIYDNDDYIPSESYYIPVRQYHLRRFYPQGGIGTLGYYPGLIGGSVHHGLDDVHYYHGGLGSLNRYGGESIGRSGYNSGNQHINDESFNDAYGRSLGNVYYDQGGYNGDKIGLYNSNGNSGLYLNQVGGQNRIEDGRTFSGGKYVNQGAQNADELNQKSFHKKGRVVKGFKKSHHNDEEGKNEEYYDEEHNEGDSRSYNGQKGQFEAGGQSNYKGVADNSAYTAGQKQSKGYYDTGSHFGKHNLDQNEYGRNNYISRADNFGRNSGYDADSLLGHQESADFYKKYHHVPFFHH